MQLGIYIAIAVILDFVLGDPYGFPHPVIYIGKCISFLDKKGRKYCRTPRRLRLWGLLIVVLISSISYGIPYVLLYFIRPFSYLYHIVYILILWTTIAATSLRKEGMKVYDALIKGDIETARIKLSYIVGRDTQNLTREEIIRADIETIAENTSDGIIAPLFFAMIGGAPLAMLYKGINTMDSMLGYTNKKYKDIGYFPAKVDDIANLIPARLTGILFCLISPIWTQKVYRAFRIMMRDRKNHKSPNSAYPEGAVAGVLGIQLGGSSNYFGETIIKPTIGDEFNKLDVIHIKQTVQMMYTVEVLLVCLYFII